jgi:hypothetical protein
LDVDPLAAPVVQRRSPRRRPAARPGHRPTTSRLGRRLTDTQHKIAGLVSAIESGIEPTLLGQQLATRIAEKDRILREIGRLEPPGAVSAREIRGLIEMVGSVADALESANHEEHHRIYAACRLTCEYDPETRSVRASIVDPTDGAWGFERVRGGT